jgi:hypothetical protein
MAAKRTLTFRRDGKENLITLVNWLIRGLRKMLISPEFGSIADLVPLIRLRRELEPQAPAVTTVKWID